MATTDLISVLPVSEVRFVPDYMQVHGLQGSGRPRAIDLGEFLWSARIVCSVMTRAEQRQAEALVDKLRGAIGTFYCWNPKAQYPEADPDGTILGDSEVTIYAIGGDQASLSLAGLPVGYQLSVGDFLSFEHGSDPVHRCLHKFVDGGSSPGSSVSPVLAVVPPLRPGVETGLPVTLKRPAAEMFIVPGSYDSYTTRPPLGAMTLNALQVA